MGAQVLVNRENVELARRDGTDGTVYEVNFRLIFDPYRKTNGILKHHDYPAFHMSMEMGNLSEAHLLQRPHRLL